MFLNPGVFDEMMRVYDAKPTEPFNGQRAYFAETENGVWFLDELEPGRIWLYKDSWSRLYFTTDGHTPDEARGCLYTYLGRPNESQANDSVV